MKTGEEAIINCSETTTTIYNNNNDTYSSSSSSHKESAVDNQWATPEKGINLHANIDQPLFSSPGN